MEFQVETGRIWLPGEQGHTLAEVLYPAAGEGTVSITHTFVDDSLRGQGVAGKLMEAVAQELRRKDKKAKLTCSYAAGWFPKHPEYDDILAK